MSILATILGLLGAKRGLLFEVCVKFKQQFESVLTI